MTRTSPRRNDIGFHAKSQANAAEILTPNFDALAAEGVILDRHYGTWRGGDECLSAVKRGWQGDGAFARLPRQLTRTPPSVQYFAFAPRRAAHYSRGGTPFTSMSSTATSRPPTRPTPSAALRGCRATSRHLRRSSRQLATRRRKRARCVVGVPGGCGKGVLQTCAESMRITQAHSLTPSPISVASWLSDPRSHASRPWLPAVAVIS